jgi:dienelactone hydrolase
MLGTYGVDANDLAAIVPHAQIMAQPVRDQGARPVVILAPGGGSFIELSTSLAEQLASHGYVVVTVQPDVAADAGLNVGDGKYTSDEVALTQQVGDRMRFAQIDDAIRLLGDPLTERLVGPVDATRIAVGGHSYAGSIAFNASLADPRISAVFDLDGTLFGHAGDTPVSVPSLVLMAEMHTTITMQPDSQTDPRVAESIAAAARAAKMLRTAPNTVTVGLRGAVHYSVTDLPAITDSLPSALRQIVTDPADTLGRTGTTDTNTIVMRFLDAALAKAPHLATAAALVQGLPGTIADPLAGVGVGVVEGERPALPPLGHR